MNHWLIRTFIAAVAVIATDTFVVPVRAFVTLDIVSTPLSHNRPQLSGFTGYQWHLQTTDGSLIQRVDAQLALPMHQGWLPAHGTNGIPSAIGIPTFPGKNADSYLAPVEGALISSNQSENNNVLSSPLAGTSSYNYGIGDYLSGSFALLPVDQDTETPLAWTVVPNSYSEVDFNYRLDVTTSSGVFTVSQGTVPPPPPSPPRFTGGIVGKATKIAPPFLSPESNLTGYVAYQLDLVAPKGFEPFILDVSIQGPLHQRWSDPDFDGIPDPSPSGVPSTARGDSHLTPPQGAQILGSNVLGEDNLHPSPLSDGQYDYGVGSGLRGQWRIPEPTTTAAVAYVVIPEDFNPRRLDINIEVFTQYHVSQIFLTAADFFSIPEPTTLATCSLGLLVLTTRRTRISTFIQLSKRNPS